MKKGQYFTLEQVMLFAMGVMITTGIYFSLSEVSEIITKSTEEDQINELSEFIKSEITQAYLSPGYYRKILNIPKKLSGQGYKIQIRRVSGENKLRIEMEESYVEKPLREEMNASGMLFSSAGKMYLEKREGKIRLWRLR